ncbi:MAG TPA: hypothetical protein VFM77_17975 [Terriglobales bacterium]|nr:hypothetical protein [Terriglobales bacterium]
MGILSIPNYLSQIGAPNPLQFDEQYVRQEMKALATELKEVEAEIAAVKAMIHGLSVIYGPEIAGDDVLQSVRPEPRTNKRGLTPACRTVLKQAERPYAVSEICAQVNELNPELLLSHRKPMASVMSVLRSMERRRQVVRARESGRSVWRLAERPLAQ